MKKNSLFYTALFFISAALLAFEISLMRILKVEGFGNLTFSAIALALTGFGAGGTIIFLFNNLFKGKEYPVSFFCSILFVFFLGTGFYLSGHISFDPLQVVWDKRQLLKLLIRFIIYTIPFTTGSINVVLAFQVAKAGRVYFFNLLGSSWGIISVLLGLYIFSPENIIALPLIFGFFSGISLLFLKTKENLKSNRISGFQKKRKLDISKYHEINKTSNRSIINVSICLLFTVTGFLLFLKGQVVMLPYKGIQLALNLPDAEVIKHHFSPFGTLKVVKSKYIRKAPGMSLGYEAGLPEQVAVFLDGDSLSIIDIFKTPQEINYLNYQTQSAPYVLHQNPRVLVLGLGGGVPVERAFLNSASRVTVAEENPYLIKMVKKFWEEQPLWPFQKEKVDIVNNSGRNYLIQSGSTWDIIELSIPDTSVSSIGGIYAADTNYNLTIEAFSNYLKHTSPHGMVSITLYLKNPPRNLLKTINNTSKALTSMGKYPARCTVVIRGWATATLLVKKQPFTPQEINKIKKFARTMMFDTVYYPGIPSGVSNQYNIVKNDLYYKGVSAIMQKDEKFIQSYLFNIYETTDNRPYFSYFFRVGKLGELLSQIGEKWVLVVEGGYVVLFTTFITVSAVAFIFIFFPLLFAGKRIKKGKLKILLYFTFIALGYMFIEIVYIEKMSRFLANPLYSSSATIAALLVFSGIGAFLSDRIPRGPIRKRVLVFTILFIAVYFISLVYFSGNIMQKITKNPLSIKMLVSAILLSPLGFAMGIPFPAAMETIKYRRDDSVPWAWSVNGYFSVVASSGVVLMASSTGFLLTGILACSFYLLAMLIFSITLQ